MGEGVKREGRCEDVGFRSTINALDGEQSTIATIRTSCVGLGRRILDHQHALFVTW